MKKIKPLFISCALLLTSLLTPFSHVEAVNQMADRGRVAVDAAGNVLAVWQAFDSENYNWKIQTATFPAAGSEWTPTADLFVSQTQSAMNPVVRMNQDGSGVVVWLSADAENQKSLLEAAVYFNGTWTGMAIISDQHAENVAQDYDVQLSASGVAVASWTSYLGESGQSCVRSARSVISEENTWEAPVQLSN